MSHLLALTLAALALALGAPAAAQAPASTEVLHEYADLTLAPDGDRIATVENDRRANAAGPEHGRVVIRDASGAVQQRLDPCSACRYGGTAWSPDGRTLAFLASGEGQATLYLANARGVRPLTRLRGLMASPRWSADGASLAVLAVAENRRETGATQPGVRQVGEIGQTDDHQRIAVVRATGGDLRFVTPELTYVYEYDWTPDGQGFVGTAAEGNGDNNWWVATLRAWTLAGGERVVAAPRMQMNYPRVSPDGRTVAFIGGLMSDFGSVGGDVFTVPLAGGTPGNVTPNARQTFTSLAWRAGALVAGVTARGQTGAAIIYPETRQVRMGFLADATLGSGDGRLSLSRNADRAAWVSDAYAQPPRIEVGNLMGGRPVTHDNDALAPAVTARSIGWASQGRQVQGWLLTPVGAAPAGRRQPMIVNVHGGPAAAFTPRFVWTGPLRSLARGGYLIFQPNPRGAYGSGEASVRANVADFGGGDLRDILAGVDVVTRTAPVDPGRIGVYGHSYGGFMSMWAVTHTNRFAAAVAGAGIANWSSYYGQNGIDQWMVPYFGATFYERPEVYDRLSPIRSIRNARTPTFIYVGERDLETPAAQSLEFWHGLNAMNVPTSLVIYQDEGHGIRQPEHQRDLENRIVRWFDTRMPATSR